jgi:hypothetical protein
MLEVTYSFDENVLINGSAEMGLSGWEASGLVESVTGGVSSRCFELNANSSLRQTLHLARNVDVFKLSAYMGAPEIAPPCQLPSSLVLEIYYTDGTCSKTVVPFVVTLNDIVTGIVNGAEIQFYYFEAIQKVEKKEFASIVVEISTGALDRPIYVDEVSLQPNIQLQTQVAETDVPETVYYRTHSIDSQVVTIVFPTSFALEPSVLVSVYGDVTQFTPEFIVEWSEEQNAYMYTKLNLSFPETYIGKHFAILVIGR